MIRTRNGRSYSITYESARHPLTRTSYWGNDTYRQMFADVARSSPKPTRISAFQKWIDLRTAKGKDVQEFEPVSVGKETP